MIDAPTVTPDQWSAQREAHARGLVDRGGRPRVAPEGGTPRDGAGRFARPPAKREKTRRAGDAWRPVPLAKPQDVPAGNPPAAAPVAEPVRPAPAPPTSTVKAVEGMVSFRDSLGPYDVVVYTVGVVARVRPDPHPRERQPVFAIVDGKAVARGLAVPDGVTLFGAGPAAERTGEAAWRLLWAHEWVGLEGGDHAA